MFQLAGVKKSLYIELNFRLLICDKQKLSVGKILIRIEKSKNIEKISLWNF